MLKVKIQNPLIRLEGVWMHFDSRVLFCGISHVFSKGEKILLIGPSGSGKSTFLKLLSGLISPSEGKIGYHTDRMIDTRENIFSSFYRDHIGVFLNDALFFEKNTVADNILFPALFWGYQYRKDFFDELTLSFEIAALLEKAASSLSSGERERVNLVRMFLYEPTILFLDEPFSHLDMRLSLIGRDFLSKYSASRDTTLVIATHSPEIFPECTREIHFPIDHPFHITE